MASEFSYDFQNQKRDLTDLVGLVLQNVPTLINVVGFSGTATNTKHEWLEDILSGKGGTLAEALDNSETGVDVATGQGVRFKAGMVITFVGYSEVMLVTGVTTDTLTVTRGYGSTTPEAIATATSILVIGKPEPESSLPGQDDVADPTGEYNYTQIFRATAKVSGTAQAIPMYGVASELNRQVQRHLTHLLQDVNRSLIYGRRVQRTSSANGSMGGILQFLAGGNVVTPTPVSPATTVAVTDTIINDALETALKAGGTPTVILCNSNQARRISAFNNSKLVIQNGTTTTGNSVNTFVSDLPIGQLSTIVIDVDFPPNQIALLDTTKIRVMPLVGRGFTDVDATAPGADYVARTIYGEYTAEIRNGKQAHALITGLTI